VPKMSPHRGTAEHRSPNLGACLPKSRNQMR
jgi:hypothetical protein